MSAVQKIADIEAEIARTQKNKATNAHLGVLKAKISKLKASLLEDKGAGGGGGEGFDVPKTGDCRVGLIGFPSVGKSTLLTKLTGVFSEAAAYEFTTLTCVPGIFQYRGAKIQLLDLPGIIEGAKDGKGRGKQVIAVGRTCNLVLICLDVLKPMIHKSKIEKELFGFGIRLNKKPPQATFVKTERGGVTVNTSTPLTKIDTEGISAICREYKLSNAAWNIKEDVTADDIVDVIEGNRVYMPGIFVLNKIDQISIEELDVLNRIPHNVPISAAHGWNLDGLVEKIWNDMTLVRIYTKPSGEIPDYSQPVIMKAENPTLRAFCNRIHRDFASDFKYAWVWGKSVKFNPQKVGIDHHLCDEDVVQIVKA
eukprot:GHVH01001664.1.p1 GENE.GHVH01001664.1~~GHVH01001664.1.p1  ORF type:complete len:366 (-),score=62.44 GHVH01001664.1:50-1147(-)